jgi:hypothetical protein
MWYTCNRTLFGKKEWHMDIFCGGMNFENICYVKEASLQYERSTTGSFIETENRLIVVRSWGRWRKVENGL